MTKRELAEAIAAAHPDLNQTSAAAVVETVIETVTAKVAAGEDVSLAGFGTFERRERSARTGRNPQTGETIDIAASKAPAFKPAAAFKRAVAG